MEDVITLAKIAVLKGVKILPSLPLVQVVALLVIMVAVRDVQKDVRTPPSHPVVWDVAIVVI